MDIITEGMGNTRLSDGPEALEQLLFRPQANSGIAETVLNDIPRYLFRVASPRSDGNTNEIWVRSESARRNRNSSTEDIFSNLDSEKRTEIARTLNLHLRWWPKGSYEDNFVSWTSSLLFAIQYIYYRHLSHRDGSCLAEIKLYIIDTTKFPRGTFLRDLDLIDAFCESEESLKDLRSLRNRPGYYFGEYLSQGSLKIESKCQMIPAEIIFEQDRLHCIQPKFADLHRDARGEKPAWVKEVNRLRHAIWSDTNLPIYSAAEMSSRLQAVEEIIQNVASGWRFPIAIYFAALIGSESSIEGQETANDNLFFAFFRSVSSHVDLQKQEEFQPSNFNVIAPDTMPELKQVEKLVREIHKHSQLIRALDHVREAELIIRNLHIQNIFSENGHAFVTDDQNKILNRTGQNILSKLGTVQMLCKDEIGRAHV